MAVNTAIEHTVTVVLHDGFRVAEELRARADVAEIVNRQWRGCPDWRVEMVNDMRALADAVEGLS